MKVLVINCGSSSLKYQLIDMTTKELLCKGLVERIGIEGSNIAHQKVGMDKFCLEVPMKDHTDGISHVINALLDENHGVIKSMDEIGAVGHRVVHGGEKYASSVLVTEEVKKAIVEVSDLAPLHNPANLIGIEACEKLMPETPQVVVFDTAFHQTMSPEAYMYAIPYEYYEKYGIRKYGFHGTSHMYVANRTAEILGKDLKDLKMITCHIGNGSSVAAVKNGKCIDTTMGLTPLAGLVMGTRSGDLDPAVVEFIAEKENLTAAQVVSILNKKSGMLGLSGIGSDFRELNEATQNGNERAKMTLEVAAHRVKSFIGSYIAAMNGVDVIVFTAGIGENGILLREMICKDLDNLGIKLDPVKNNIRAVETELSADDSKVKILLVPTNEELMIATDTYNIVTNLK